MAALHETTRRTLCRIAFLMLCVVPTFCTVAWCVASSLPARKTDAEALLGSLTELVVEIDELSYPQPGVTLCRGIELSDPESQRILAHIDWAEHRTATEGSILVLSNVEVDATRLDRFAALIQRQLKLLHTSSAAPLRWTAEQVTLGAESGSTTLARVAGEIAVGDTTTRVAMRFALPETAAHDPIRLVMERTRMVDAPRTRVELHTGGTPIPVATLVPVVPALVYLGPQAEFSGQLWCTELCGVWSGELTGNLTHVDLDRLVTGQFPLQATGEAQITLQKLGLEAGRMTALTGRIEAGPGVVSRSLLEAAIESLGMAAGEPVRASDDRAFKYQQLAVAFQLDAAQLSVEGACKAAGAAGAAIVDDGGAALLATTSRRAQPALSLVRFLVPPSRLQVPATQETQWLLQTLPIPSTKGGTMGAQPKLRGVEAAAPLTTDH